MLTEDVFGMNVQSAFMEETETEPVKKKNKKAKKNNKITYATVMANCPASPFKCKTHTTDNLKLKTVNKNPPTCRSCGFKCQGLKGFLTCAVKSGCFDICSACKICPQNHILRNCMSLKQYSDTSELYGQNKFKCSNCTTEQEVGKQGVMHCNVCSFSICMSCMSKLDEIWEQQVQQKKKDEGEKNEEKNDDE